MAVGREVNERLAQIGRYFMRKILRYTSLIVMVFVPLRPGVVEALQSWKAGLNAGIWLILKAIGRSHSRLTATAIRKHSRDFYPWAEVEDVRGWQVRGAGIGGGELRVGAALALLLRVMSMSVGLGLQFAAASKKQGQDMSETPQTL